MASKSSISWTGPALEDLRAIRDYVSRADPAAARMLASKIRAGAKRLADHPLPGREVPELAGLGYREIIISSYRIVYRAERRKVVILRVWHGRMSLLARKR